MPRTSRQKSKTGIYHVMMRGINRQNIFENDEDKIKFLDIISKCKELSGFRLLGYCLMSNHVHILLKEEEESIEKIFRRIGARYVYWYNEKYNRSGHLFQDRFKSEVVENDGYFLTVLRYILQNPIKAEMVVSLSSYKWSSYNDYIKGSGITDIEFALKMFSENEKMRIKEFTKYMSEFTNDTCLELKEASVKISDEDLLHIIAKEFKINAISIQNLDLETQVKILRYLKALKGTSYNQISRLTGLTIHRIFKA